MKGGRRVAGGVEVECGLRGEGEWNGKAASFERRGCRSRNGTAAGWFRRHGERVGED